MADDTDYKTLQPPRCGATRKKDGKPCLSSAMKNGRCRLHGGKSTGAPGNKNGYKHGFYYNHLSPEEQAEWPQAAAMGSGAAALEADLTLMRIKLARLLKAARDAGNEDVSERVERHVDILMKAGLAPDSDDLGGYDKKELKTTLPHLGSLIVQAVETIRKLSLSIAQLKVTEKELTQDDSESGEITLAITRLSKRAPIDTES